MKRFTNLSTLALSVAVLLVSSVAFGVVKREGAWPDADKAISIDVAGVSKADAVKRIAEAAGWSVVIHAPPGDPIDIHVKNQPAGKVLDLVLSDGAYTAHRDGDLVEIDRDRTTTTEMAAPAVPIAPVPPVAATPPAPPAPAAPAATVRGEDRVVTGKSLRIEKGETVNDVTVYGGSVDVYGVVTGDLVVTGGSARIHDGARVEGDVTAVGGSLDVEKGASVEGDVGVVGGIVNRADGAKIGGKVVSSGPDDDEEAADSDAANVHGGVMRAPHAMFHGWTHSAGSALTRTSMLFVFGAMLLALGGRRMDALRVEVAARPMRSLALGVVGGLAGLVTVVLLCVTVIGIPVAVVGVLLAVFGVYAGVCAALTTVGAALIRHKTTNPYVHLAFGCGLFLLVGAIPYVGGLVTAAVALVGIGVLVATRGAGMIRPRGPGAGPYRTPEGAAV